MVAIPAGLIAGHLAPQMAATERGPALEACVREVFGLIPGVTFHSQHVVDNDGVEEVDLFFRNDGHPDGLPFLPLVLAVECKNWQRPLSPNAVGYFALTLRHRSLTDGILVAASGLGGGDGSGATELVSRSLQEGVRVLVLTTGDLLALSSTENLVETLRQRFIDLVVSGVPRLG